MKKIVTFFLAVVLSFFLWFWFVVYQADLGCKKSLLLYVIGPISDSELISHFEKNRHQLEVIVNNSYQYRVKAIQGGALEIDSQFRAGLVSFQKRQLATAGVKFVRFQSLINQCFIKEAHLPSLEIQFDNMPQQRWVKVNHEYFVYKKLIYVPSHPLCKDSAGKVGWSLDLDYMPLKSSDRFPDAINDRKVPASCIVNAFDPNWGVMLCMTQWRE